MTQTTNPNNQESTNRSSPFSRAVLQVAHNIRSVGGGGEGSSSSSSAPSSCDREQPDSILSLSGIGGMIDRVKNARSADLIPIRLCAFVTMAVCLFFSFSYLVTLFTVLPVITACTIANIQVKLGAVRNKGNSSNVSAYKQQIANSCTGTRSTELTWVEIASEYSRMAALGSSSTSHSGVPSETAQEDLPTAYLTRFSMLNSQSRDKFMQSVGSLRPNSS